MSPAADRPDGRRRWARAAALASFAAAPWTTGADRASFASANAPENLSHYALSHEGRMMVDGTKLNFYDNAFEYDVDVGGSTRSSCGTPTPTSRRTSRR